MIIFPKNGPFVLSLKRKAIVYAEHLLTIYRQCATMLDAIFAEHVTNCPHTAGIIITVGDMLVGTKFTATYVGMHGC